MGRGTGSLRVASEGVSDSFSTRLIVPGSLSRTPPLQTYCMLFSGFLLANAQAASLIERMLPLFICSIYSAVQICEIYRYTMSSDKYFYVEVKVIVLMSAVL